MRETNSQQLKVWGWKEERKLKPIDFHRPVSLKRFYKWVCSTKSSLVILSSSTWWWLRALKSDLENKPAPHRLLSDLRRVALFYWASVTTYEMALLEPSPQGCGMGYKQWSSQNNWQNPTTMGNADSRSPGAIRGGYFKSCIGDGTVSTEENVC